MTHHNRRTLIESISSNRIQETCRLQWVINATMSRVGVVPCSVCEFRLHKSCYVRLVGGNDLGVPRVQEIGCAFGILVSAC